ncbi:MAG: GFA family protein [Gammaproteobacteria bacterium]|jgi:hypothetical protein
MNSKHELTGGCQCGAVRYRLTGSARMLYACHCRDCQKQSSSAFGMSLIVDRAKVEFTAGLDRLRTWDTRGDDATLKRCAFCSDCGTRIYHAPEDEAEPISIKAGSLDDTGWLQPVAQIWLQSAQPWVGVDRDRFRCFEQEPDDEGELEIIWQRQSRGA